MRSLAAILLAAGTLSAHAQAPAYVIPLNDFAGIPPLVVRQATRAYVGYTTQKFQGSAGQFVIETACATQYPGATFAEVSDFVGKGTPSPLPPATDLGMRVRPSNPTHQDTDRDCRLYSSTSGVALGIHWDGQFRNLNCGLLYAAACSR